MYNKCASCINECAPFSDVIVNTEEDISFEKWTNFKEAVDKQILLERKLHRLVQNQRK